jgi:hypothetical protein
MTELYTELTDEQRKTAAVLSSRLFAPTTHLADIDVDPAE